MATVTVSFTVDSEKDRDLVRWLDGLPRRKRSEAIREALRAYLGRWGVTLGDVYQAVKALERKLSTGVVVASGSLLDRDEPDAPPDVLAALDSLGL
jgi:Arc/MetJ-type ribon-helix-helix transcriptional regulator